MDWARQDLRHALRLFARRPGFALLAVLTLAVGLSVNTVAFSAVNALLFKPLRFKGAESTGWLFVASGRDRLANTSVPVFEALEKHTTSVEGVAAEGRMPLAYDSGTGTQQIWALFVSSQYFSLIETTPVAGRLIGGSDGTAGDVPAVVSERFWRRRLDARPDIGSLTLSLDSVAAHVVGVIPDEFQGPGGVFEPDIWLPLAARHTLGLPPRYAAPDAQWLRLVARPRPNVPAAAVEQEVATIAATAGPAAADQTEQLRAQYVRFADGHPEIRGLWSAATLGLAAVGIVLLIACFNVAGLVLARSVERQRTLALLAALGASRWRIARAQLTEGVVLAFAGCALALLLTLGTERFLSVFSLPAPIPQRLHFVMDWRVIAFATALALTSAIVPALVPLFRIARADLARGLGTTGSAQAHSFGRGGPRRVFVSLQVAGSTGFLALALLFGGYFVGKLGTDTGFDTDRIAVLEINPSLYGYSPDRARQLADRISASARTIPGVENVSVADHVSFFVGATPVGLISLDGQSCEVTDCPRASVYAADSRFFDAMGIRLVAGRVYDDRPDDRDAVVVSTTAAARFWPDAYPVGQSFRLEPEGRLVTVVGVAADITHRMLNEVTQPSLYRALIESDYGSTFTVVARGAVDADAAVAALGRAAHEADPRVPVQSLQSMWDRMALPLWMPRTTAGFFGTCGLAAALLSTIGLFGVTYFAVSRRRREFGVRFALGATRSDVRRQVLGDTFRLAGPGIAGGAVLAVLAGLTAAASVEGLAAGSATPYLGAVLLQGATVLLAAWSPATHAARSSPLEVLRAE